MRETEEWRGAGAATYADACTHTFTVINSMTTPVPVIEYAVPAPTVTNTAPAPVTEYRASAPAVTCATPASETDYVTYSPVIDYIATAPAVMLFAPSQLLLPAYTMESVTTGVGFDTNGLVNAQSPITAVEPLPHKSLVLSIAWMSLLRLCSAMSVRNRSLGDGSEHTGIPYCAGANDRAGSSRSSGCGADPGTNCGVRQGVSARAWPTGVPVPQIQESIAKGVKVIPQERFPERTVEQIEDIPVPQAVGAKSVERVQQHTVEQIEHADSVVQKLYQKVVEHPAFPRATDSVHRQSGQRLADEEKSGMKADLLRIIREEELELKADLIRVYREEIESVFVILM